VPSKLRVEVLEERRQAHVLNPGLDDARIEA
jgi:hypothetical protein